MSKTQRLGFQDTVIIQIEDRGRSITVRRMMLVQGPDQVIDTFLRFAEDELQCPGLLRLGRRLRKAPQETADPQ